MTRVFLTLLLCVLAGGAQAHKASDSFLYWDAANQEVPGRLDIALVDLARAMSLDSDGDGQLRWGELEAQQSEISAYLASQITLLANAETCSARWRLAGLTQHSDGNYLAMEFRPNCPEASELPGEIRYDLFFEDDPLHRALVMTRVAGTERLAVLSPDQRSLNLAETPNMWETAREFIWEGMVHLWIGYDHMLFLLALVLPAALRRQDGRWVVEDRVSVAIKDVALIVTAFTVAHSITLVIATLGLVNLPIAWVETFIALSIVAAAINIVWPFLGQRRYLIGFGFGLIHGFGFASVLSGFMAHASSRLVALASFNIGVELAQLAIVVVVVPLIFLLRRQWLYQRVLLPAGVVAIVLTGMFWVWERAPLTSFQASAPAGFSGGGIHAWANLAFPVPWISTAQ